MSHPAKISNCYIENVQVDLKSCARDLAEFFARRSSNGKFAIKEILAEAFCQAIEFLTNLSSSLSDQCIDNIDPETQVIRARAEQIFSSLTDRGLELPYDWPGRLYEHLLQFTGHFDSPHDFKLISLSRSKKRLGSFYTPIDLAQFAVDKAFHDLVYDESNLLRKPDQIRALRILDPSMGGGTFLIAALKYLSARLRESLFEYEHTSIDDETLAQTIVDHCLYGIDLDPAAVKIARLCLALACGQSQANSNLLAHLKCGNALVGCDSETIQANFPQGDPSSWPAKADQFCRRWFHEGERLDNRSPRGFHWPVEFSHIFSCQNPGFDAVIGNPPWEIQKPNSREFFHSADDSYWSLSKQEALQRQHQFCQADERIQNEWLNYQSEYKVFSKWLQESGRFVLQGSSDINVYKLFIELAYRLVRQGGMVSLIVPSGIYSDKGACRLRSEILSQCRWKYLYGFDNNRGIFDIHRSFKFCIIGFEKGGRTTSIMTTFGASAVQQAGCAMLVPYATEALHAFSPRWSSLLEVSQREDLQLMEKIASNSILLADFVTISGMTYRREFDMTNDSHLFMLRDKIECDGYRSDAYGHWLAGPWKPITGIGDVFQRTDLICSVDGASVIAVEDVRAVALPLYEGRMIGQFNVSDKGWLSGKGRRAAWVPTVQQRIMPQYLVRAEDYQSDFDNLKVAFLGVGSATNARSMISACIGSLPCGNSVPVFLGSDPVNALVFTACLNSFVFDYILRLKLSGNNLNYFLLQECLLPPIQSLQQAHRLARLVARLNLNHKRFAPQLMRTALCTPQQWAVCPEERLRLRCIIDAVIADLYGLDCADLHYILRQCDLPEQQLVRNGSNLNAKGFWRIDKNKPAHLRQTILTLRAFEELRTVGMERFIDQAEQALVVDAEMEKESSIIRALRNRSGPMVPA